MRIRRLAHKINLSVYSKKLLFISAFLIFVSGCSHDPSRVRVKELRTPPKVTSGSHIVSDGETLFSIAWLYSRDFKELAANNRISQPYTIYPGQHIDLRAKKKVSRRVSTSKTVASSASKSSAKTSMVKKTAVKKSPSVIASSGPLKWLWPADGKIVQGYSSGSSLNKGIDIRAKLGEPVSAASTGQVVYAGNELAGYGKLIIVKHNNSYLSAYAHNKELLVREGDSVKAGQKIAEIGSTGTTEPKLHFEIRRNGKPVDPLRFLPRR